MNKLRFLILAIVVIAFSCKKDDDPTPESFLTTSKGWKITATTVDPPLPVYGVTTITDVYAQLDACNKDEVILFASAGTYKVENSVKCDSSEDSISESGTWTLSSDKKTLKFIPTGDDSYEATILSLDKTTMKATQTSNSGGTKYTYTFTFTAQ